MSRPACGTMTAHGGEAWPNRLAVARSPVLAVMYAASAARMAGKVGCAIHRLLRPLGGSSCPASLAHHRCRQFRVVVYDERDQILYTLPTRLLAPADPELQVLRPVIALDAVLVMHAFVLVKGAAEDFLRDHPVL